MNMICPPTKRVAAVLAVALLTFFSLASAALSGEAPETKGPPAWIGALKVAFGSEAEAKGDGDKALEEMREALSRHIDSPAAEVLLLRMRGVATLDPDPRRAVHVYERLLEGAKALSGRARELLTDRIARNYRAAGSFGRAEAAEREMGYLRRWAVIGPFGYTEQSAHSREFPPERRIDFGRAEQSGHRALRWTMYEAPGSGRRVDLFKPLWPEEGACYALAQVESDEPRAGLLVFWSTGSCKVWWNGGLVGACDRGRERLPYEHAWPVVFRKGWNRLLVKATAHAPVVSARFERGDGSPLAGIQWEDRLLLHDIATRRDLTRLVLPLTSPLPRRAYDYFARCAAGTRPAWEALSRGQLALLHAASGVSARYEGRHEEALAAMQRAVELAPGFPHLWHELARTAQDSPLLPKSIRRTRSQEAYEKAASCGGGFVPAVLEIAERLRWDKKAELAIERLKRAAAENPDSPAVPLLMANVALDEGWTHEARTWAHDAEKIDPSFRPVQLFWAGFHVRARDVARAIVAHKEALSLDAWDYSSREAFAGLLIGRGDVSAGLRELNKALEADPTRLSGYRALARAETAAGRYENAVSALRAGLTLSPDYPWLRRQLGDVYLRQGREDGALAEWRMALETHPGWHELRRQVAAIKGEADDFSIPYSTDVARAISESKSPEDYPNSDVILVVDLTVDRIYADGSYSEITHQARKALTTEGVEKLSDIRIEGELLEARTHRPDGTTLEPAVLPGRGSLTMPGVEIGAVVEYKYRRDHPAPDGGLFKLPGWYFRGLETPHQWSNYVVIAPESMKLTVVKRHWSKEYPEERFEEFTPKVENGLRVYRWLATNTRPLNPSAGHDHMSTLLPHVEVGRARSWEDLTGELLDLFLGRTRLTRRIREEAGKAALGATTVEEKARAIFRHVCGLVQADAEVYDAHQILLTHAGSRSVLLAAMLSAAGLDARFALTRPRPEAMGPSEGPGEPEWAFPDRSMFHDTLVAVAREDGETLWLDAEGPYSVFGAVPPRFQGGLAFVLPSTNVEGAGRSFRCGTFETLPWGPLREHGEVTRTFLNLDPETDVLHGLKEFHMSGSVGAAYKELFAESSATWRQTWAEKRLSKVLRGSRLGGIEIEGLDDPGAPLTVRTEFEVAEAMGPGPVDRAGVESWRETPTGVEPLEAVSAYVKVPKRTYAMKIPSPLVRDDEVEVRLPGVESWAPPSPHTAKTSFGSYSLSFTREGDVMWIRRSVTLLPQVVEPQDYDEFVRFCRGIDAAEHAPMKALFP
jgi:tetratricopeptide (TPR) repeat protein